MLPPKDVYSVVIHNETASEKSVEVAYRDLDGQHVVETIKVPAHGTGNAAQKTFEKGPTTFTYVISSVKVHGADQALTAPMPGVSGPTKDYAVHIKEENGKVHVSH